MCTRGIVGWSMSATQTAALVDDALMMGITRRKPTEGLVHHSDHGSQYRSLMLGKTLAAKGIVPSMGNIKSPWDNAPTESLMATIKKECVHRTTFKSREEARLAIFEYIEVFYNKLRLHSSLGNSSSAEFEATLRMAGTEVLDKCADGITLDYAIE